MKSLWKRIRAAGAEICLVDWSLLLFMAILLCYTAENLFGNAPVTQSSEAIDIIARTSAAAIFGYFISGNFNVTPTQEGNREKENEATLPGRDAAQAASGAADTEAIPKESSPAASDVSRAVPEKTAGRRANPVQILAVAIVGLLALCFLLVAREQGREDMAAIAQLQDFVSASVGFLVSHGKSK